MNFTAFWNNLKALEESIAITSPVMKKVHIAYWGAPYQSQEPELPCFVNALSEPDRVIGFGNRDQRFRISVQLLVAKATVEDPQSSMIATAFWFAAKDAFDYDITFGDTVNISVLKGSDPTVPVILQHGGAAYIGFNAILEIQSVEDMDFNAHFMTAPQPI